MLVIIAVVCAVLAIVLPRKTRDSPIVTPPSASPGTEHWPCREVLHSNFPDPNLLRHNGTWYAFATNNAAGHFGLSHVQLATSPDFVNWTLCDYTEDPLPKLGDWLVPKSNLWAPNVLQRADSKFVLYYAATAANATGNHCVGAAVGDSPQGPYDPLPTPLACPTEIGGAIDPSSIIDSDGSIYLAYKVDGNNRGNGGDCENTVPPLKDTPILLQKLEQDGTTPLGPPVKILDRTYEDGPLVEAPNLIRTVEGIYFLFFSSGCTRLPSYDVKYATSSNITGPYVRSPKRLLKTGDMGLLAPGSVSVTQDKSKWRMVFHARVKTDFGGVRAMYTANLIFNKTDASFDPAS
ncbi:Arabinanase/levansucrase/invertase [Lindgomyces ingoldianus]|uniref:Arabinanase/levansucrase/invertase n=1 Tax=Lindgomyces ingoldianus TaxID=673940 RepID=A0ACB6R2Y7_9PLEO|nr:Arabinanase/levansucrase/invertase [Lindgomyces ingoldianus]KAF2473536.1 Arabinanase/levansucrase/invertase [Lindgomyces ingoldianus]